MSTSGLEEECLHLTSQLKELNAYNNALPEDEKDIRVSEYVHWIKAAQLLADGMFMCTGIIATENSVVCQILGEGCKFEICNNRIVCIKVQTTIVNIYFYFYCRQELNVMEYLIQLVE